MKMINFVCGIFCFVIVTSITLESAEKSITSWGPNISPEWMSKYRFHITPSQKSNGNSQQVDRFCLACFEGDKKIVESFISEGVDINGLNTVDIKLRDKNDWHNDIHLFLEKRHTPLMCAIEGDKADIVNLLLNNSKINIEQTNADNQTALHRAVISGFLDYVTLLLNKGAQINGQDNTDSTPLHCSTLDLPNVDVSITKYLIKSGADMRIKDNAGRTPLYSAAFSNGLRYKRVCYLLDKGAPINEMSTSGIANLYDLKNNDRPTCQSWASILFRQGSMSKEKESKKELSLSVLCFNVLEKSGLISDISGRKVNDDVRDFCIQRLVKRKTVSEVIKLLRQACHSKKIGLKTAQEIAECDDIKDNIKKNFVPGYVAAEGEYKIHERFVCYQGEECWQKKSAQEQANEKFYLLIGLKSCLEERIFTAIDNKKIELKNPSCPA